MMNASRKLQPFTVPMHLHNGLPQQPLASQVAHLGTNNAVEKDKTQSEIDYDHLQKQLVGHICMSVSGLQPAAKRCCITQKRACRWGSLDDTFISIRRMCDRIVHAFRKVHYIRNHMSSASLCPSMSAFACLLPLPQCRPHSFLADILAAPF